jgi:sugar lactone lactonase YvrE
MIDRLERPPEESPASTSIARIPLLLLLVCLPAPASTRIATTASAREFLAGEAKGTAVTADGRLTLGLPLGPRAWPDDAADAVVFGAASDSSGRIWIATGGGAGRLFVSEPSGTVSLAFTAPEPNLTAVAVAPDGTVVCASSPNGSLYRIDAAKSGLAHAATPWGSPGEEAIWALAFGKDGTLYVGTGNKGRIYRRTAAGKLELFHDVDDVHVRSLAVGPDGTLYAGTSDRGLLVSFGRDGSKRTLYDFARPEVVAIACDPKGTVYAAATSAGAAPVRAAVSDPRPARPGGTPTPTPTPAEPDEGAPRGTVSISSTTRPSKAPAAATAREGSAEIVSIAPDGFVEPAWTFPEETVYALRYEADPAGLVIATGPRGRVYAWAERHVRLVAQTGEKEVVSAPATGGSISAVTMAAAGVFRPAPGAQAGSFTSAVKDAVRLSAFGSLRFEGTVPPGSSATFFVRAGNAGKPDGTWSGWVPVGAGGGAKLPAARFFQWKAELKASPSGASPSIERVEFSYTDRNARPLLEGVAVLDPGAVISRGGASPSNILSVTNPDENGIYAGLEAPRETRPPDTAHRLYRKGFRTVTWRASDPNGDPLRFDLDAQLEGSRTWFPIRKDLDETSYSFDTTALPDGRYRFRVTATDQPAHPEGEALSVTEESEIVVIDNTPPILKVEARRVAGEELELTVLASDALSPVTRAEGAVNSDRWRPVPAADGAADSPSERFVFRVPRPSTPAVLSLRVLDAAGNWAAVSAEYPKEFR